MSLKTILADYESYLQKIPRPVDLRYKSLSDDQLVAVYAYTTDAVYNSYADINYDLRNHSISPDHFKLCQLINSSIGAILKDKSASMYYRYTALSASQVKDIYTVGKISGHIFFTSVSEVNANFIDRKCNVLLRIIPHSTVVPAYIAEISKFPHEKEYLYPPHTYFEVLQAAQLGTDKFEIFLLERPL